MKPMLGWTMLSREEMRYVERSLTNSEQDTRDEIGFLLIHQGFADRFFRARRCYTLAFAMHCSSHGFTMASRGLGIVAVTWRACDRSSLSTSLIVSRKNSGAENGGRHWWRRSASQSFVVSTAGSSLLDCTESLGSALCRISTH